MARKLKHPHKKPKRKSSRRGGLKRVSLYLRAAARR
jgi:hypothetical protein